MIICTNCGLENKPDVKFCKKCGHSLSGGRKKCGRCGNINDADAQFCQDCGATFSSGASAGASPAASRASTVLVGQFESGNIIGGRYRVLRKLGQGGFGATYLVEHVGLGSKMALKELLERSKKSVELFKKEASYLHKLQIDGVPHVSDHFEEGGKLYLAEDYIEGRSLREILRERKKLSVNEGQRLLKELLRIAGDLHGENVIHRDIKPDNIMITGDPMSGKVYLIDFGGIKEASQEVLEGRTGTALISQGYTPPEQLQGKVGFESDIYSLGMTIAECVTGVHAVELRDGLEDIDFAKFGLGDGSLVKNLRSMTKYDRKARKSNAKECLAAISDKNDRQSLTGDNETGRAAKDMERSANEVKERIVEKAVKDAVKPVYAAGKKKKSRGPVIWSIVVAAILIGLWQLNQYQKEQELKSSKIEENRKEQVRKESKRKEQAEREEARKERVRNEQAQKLEEQRKIETRKEREKEKPVSKYIHAAGLYWDRKVVVLDWYKATEYCRNKGIRLPTKDELIAGYNSGNQALRNPAGYYWSSTTYANYTSSAWYVLFSYGYVLYNVKTNTYYVRCVSPGP